MRGENSKINTTDKFSSLQVRFQSDRPGENSRNSPITPYGVRYTNGSLSPITCNIAITLDFDSVCHVILMRPDYERSNRGRPPLMLPVGVRIIVNASAIIVLAWLEERKKAEEEDRRFGPFSNLPVWYSSDGF